MFSVLVSFINQVNSPAASCRGSTTPPLKAFKGLSLKKDSLYKHLEPLLHHYVTAARNNQWDHIGEIYGEQNLVGPGQNMTPKGIVDAMLQMTYAGKTNDGYDAERFCYESYRQYRMLYYVTHYSPPTHIEPMDLPVKTQLDPCVGTGRFLFEASIMFPKFPLVLFGVEINPTLYRGCLVNMALFSKHTYSIICADTLRLDPKITGPRSRIWDLGNRWLPPDISMFYWKPPPPSPIRKDAFSLKHFVEAT